MPRKTASTKTPAQPRQPEWPFPTKTPEKDKKDAAPPCYHPQHRPIAVYISLQPGQTYTHKCPACGYETTLHGHRSEFFSNDNAVCTEDEPKQITWQVRNGAGKSFPVLLG
jgi:hypothetical protein